MDIFSIFLENARTNPNKIAIWNDGTTITYKGLEKLTNKLARILSDNGVVYADHIGILLHNDITFVASMLACANLGVTMVPLNPSLPIPSILHAFEVSNVKHILATKAFHKDVESAIEIFSGVRICSDGEIEDMVSLPKLCEVTDDNPFRPYAISGHEPFILTMTSGSTGNPKPIVLTQKCKYDRAMAAVNIYNITEDDRILAATPLYHSLAERLVLIPLLIGATSILMKGFASTLWLEHVKEQKVTFTIAVSSQLALIAETLSSPFCPEISSLRCIVSSSALLEPHIKGELLTKLNCEIHECYGTSEVAIVTNLNMTDAKEQIHSVGKPIADVKVRIINKDGIEASAMEKGEIQCMTPMLFSGYYKQPEQMQAAMRDGYFCTGDIGYLDKNGYLYFSGRIKDIIITGAVNVYPVDIEEVVSKLETVHECAAFALPDNRLGEVIGLAVVPKSGTEFSLRQLKFHCAQYLGDFQIPREFFVVKELPKNEMGKVMKQKLIDEFTTSRAPVAHLKSSKRTLRAGIIGGGFNSAIGYAHMVASTMDRFFSIEAGCFSRDEETNWKTAFAYHLDKNRVYDCWRKMLENERGELDAVIVLLPIPDHAEAVKTAVELGFPVICEKPLVMNLIQAQMLADVCESNNGFIAVTYNYTGYPIIRELRELIHEDALGDILHFQAEMPQESYVRDSASVQAWRLQEKTPSLILLDLLSHLHHMMEYVLGEQAIKVTAVEGNFGKFHGVTDDCICIAEYTKSIRGEYWVSKSALGCRNGMMIRISGSKGSAEWVQEDPEHLRLAFPDGRIQILDRGGSVKVANQVRYTRFKAGHPAGYIEAFANLYADIAEGIYEYLNGKCIQNHEIVCIDTEVRRMQFIESVARSARNRSWEIVK